MTFRSLILSLVAVGTIGGSAVAVADPAYVQLFSAQARVVGTYNSNTYQLTSTKGARLHLAVTALTAGGSITVKVQEKDQISGRFLDVPGLAFAKVTATGDYDLEVYPGIQPTGHLVTGSASCAAAPGGTVLPSTFISDPSFQGDVANTTDIYIGPTGVTTNNGWALGASVSTTPDKNSPVQHIADLAEVSCVGKTSAQKVRWIGTLNRSINRTFPTVYKVVAAVVASGDTFSLSNTYVP